MSPEAARAVSVRLGKGKSILTPLENIYLAAWAMAAIDASQTKTLAFLELRTKVKELLLLRGASSPAKMDSRVNLGGVDL